VAPESCRPCHAEIYASYLETGMGRSFRSATPDLIPSGAFFHEKSQRQYKVVQRGQSFLLQRWRLGDAGPYEKRIDLVVGSGNHSRTYLHRDGEGRLFELPLGWYAERGGHWAMSPGYDRADHSDFRRRVPDGCLFCHNGYPSAANGGVAAGIDCQRCHGPGEQHVKAGGRIVNPAKLGRERQMEVCLQCHLEAAGRTVPDAVRRFDRGPFSYRPGEPLGDFMIFFDAADGGRARDRITVNSSAYRLRQSACFERSAGKMMCTTCHNPHRRAADGQYARACRQCHSGAHAAANNDCVSCHMPKRRTEDAVHVVLTDHFIQRRPAGEEALASREETHGRYSGEVKLSYPATLSDTAANYLYVLLARLRHTPQPRQVIPEMRQALAESKPAAAQFYFEMAEACRKAGLGAEAVRYYMEAIRRKPDDAPSYVAMVQELMSRGETKAAISALETALGRMPREVDLLTSLAVAHAHEGRFAEALRLLERALEIDRDVPLTWFNLGVCLQQKGDKEGAARAYRAALLLQPDLERAQQYLAMLDRKP
jgi:tetratricopeptide (TPR) repeat protein